MFRGYATDIRHVRLGRPGEQKGIGRQLMKSLVGILFLVILVFFGSSQPAVEDSQLYRSKMDILAPLCGFMTCYVFGGILHVQFYFLFLSSLHAMGCSITAVSEIP